MACINMLGLNNTLYCSHTELKLKLLEMMLQAALVELQDSHSAETLHIRIENGAYLLRWVYDLLVLDPNRNKSKQVSVKVNINNIKLLININIVLIVGFYFYYSY